MKKIIFTFFMLFFIIFLLNSKDYNYGIVIAEKGLILRSSSTTNSKKITTIPYNAKVEVIDKNGPKDNIYGISSMWYKVKYKNKTGWVFGGFLKTANNNNETSNIKKITGKYKFNYGQYSPILILNDNNTFSMTLNVCTGMLKVSGKYQYENDTIYAKINNCQECFGFSGIEGMEVIFKIISNNKLIVENDLFRYQNGQKFGFCAPNKGDVFKK